MSKEINFLHDLFSPSFWEDIEKSHWENFKRFCSDLLLDLEMWLKLFVLIFCPKLAQKFWPSKENKREI